MPVCSGQVKHTFKITCTFNSVKITCICNTVKITCTCNTVKVSEKIAKQIGSYMCTCQ